MPNEISEKDSYGVVKEISIQIIVRIHKETSKVYAARMPEGILRRIARGI